MADLGPLAEQFEQDRARLTALAHRMLGGRAEAEDAVQEAWLRLSRVDADAVLDLRAWLTTVVSRICLDHLRARSVRREDPPDEGADGPADAGSAGADPADEVVLADSVGLAMLVVLDRLSPAERVAFVLHDMFGLAFEEVGAILGRTPVAARQLASRGRRRVQGDRRTERVDLPRQRRLVEAFLSASREGRFDDLLSLLAPDVVLTADPAAVSAGAQARTVGSVAVARTFSGRATAARLTLLDGSIGAVWSVGGRPRVAFAFTVTDEGIAGITLLAEPGTLQRIQIAPLED